jgi:cobalt/nickel transport system permease protein
VERQVICSAVRWRVRCWDHGRIARDDGRFYRAEYSFQDGGLTVLGANVFNMGLIGTFGGYYLYRAVRFALGRNSLRGTLIGVAIAAWLSVIVAAVAMAIQLALSGTVPLAVALTAMLSWHILIGVGEAIISVTTISFIWRSRPDLLYDAPRRANSVASKSLLPR